MSRQIFVNGTWIHEDGTEEYFVAGQWISEDQAAGGGTPHAVTGDATATGSADATVARAIPVVGDIITTATVLGTVASVSHHAVTGDTTSTATAEATIAVSRTYANLAALALAHWRLDEISGTTAIDQRGSYDGTYETTLPGNDSVAGLHAKTGTAIDFSLSFGHVTMGDVLDFEKDEPFTFSAWVKTNALPWPTTNFPIISKHGTGGGFVFWIVDSGVYDYVFLSAGGSDYIFKRFLRTNSTAVQHIVVTYDGSNTLDGFKCYEDGVELTTLGTSDPGPIGGSTVNSVEFEIGKRTIGAHYADGIIDEVLVFDYELEQVDVDTLYSGPLTESHWIEGATTAASSAVGIIDLGSTAQDVSGASTASGSAAGSITTSLATSGSSAGTGSAAAIIGQSLAVVGGATATDSVAGTLASSFAVSGDSVGSSSALASVATARPVAGDATATAAASATVTQSFAISATSAAAGSASATVSTPAATYEEVILTAEAYWKLDEDSSGLPATAVDETTNDYDGTYVTSGPELVVGLTPWSSGASDFSATEGHVNMGNIFAYEKTDQFSFSLWMKVKSSSEQLGNILSKQLVNGWVFWITEYATNYYIYLSAGSGDNMQYRWSRSAGSDARHVVLTYDGSNDLSGFHLYENGTELTPHTPDPGPIIGSTIRTGDFTLGGRTTTTPTYFPGVLDEVLIFDYVLSQSQVDLLLNGPDQGVVGTATATGAVAATITATLDVSGSASGTGLADATVIGSMAVAGNATATGSAAATVKKPIEVLGGAIATSSAGGLINLALPLSGASSAAGSVIGIIERPGVQRPVSGTSSATSSVYGSVDYAGTVDVLGSATSIATCIATIGARFAVVGNSTATGSAAAIPAIRKPIVGASHAIALVTGLAAIQYPISASSSSAAAASGQIDKIVHYYQVLLGGDRPRTYSVPKYDRVIEAKASARVFSLN